MAHALTSPPVHVSRAVAMVLLAVTLLLVGCGPEAARQRGQAGADIGNRDANVEIHGQTNPAYHTPYRGEAIELIVGAEPTE